MEYEVWQLKPTLNQNKYKNFLSYKAPKEVDLNDFYILAAGIFEEDFMEYEVNSVKYDIDRLDVIACSHMEWQYKQPRDWKGDTTVADEFVVKLNGHYYLYTYTEYIELYGGKGVWLPLAKSAIKLVEKEEDNKTEDNKGILKVLAGLSVVIAIIGVIVSVCCSLIK